MMGEPLDFGFHGYHPEYPLNLFRTFRDTYGLQFVDSGSVMRLETDTKPTLLVGPAMWCAYPGPAFRYGPASEGGSWSHRFVMFTGSRVESYAREGLFPFEPGTVRLSGEYGQRMDLLMEACKRRDRLGRWRATHMLEDILLGLAEDRAAGNRHPAWLLVVLGELDAACAQGRGVDYAGMARALGMSLPTLRRRFRELVGKPLHAYVVGRRMDQAVELLRGSDLPLKGIAYRLGYYDIAFFCRQFKKYKGVPPGAFRA